MDEPKVDLVGWVGFVIFCLAILAFIGLVKCQADFFQNLALIF